MTQPKTIKRIAAIVLVDFFALNLYALYSVGGQGLLDMIAQAGPWTWVLIAEFLIALTMVCGYMWRDASAHGARPLGYIFITMLTGSIGPLLYLIRRPAHAAGDHRPGPRAA